MKKKFKILLSICIVLSLLLCLPVSAAQNIKVYVDGQKVLFDVGPRLVGGRTMVPLRAIFEALGATVEWEEETKTVTAYNEAYIVKSTIGKNEMFVNNESISIDVPPMIVDSRTFVPARFVAEAFNCNVEWDHENFIVKITSKPIDYSSLEKDTSNNNTNNNSNNGNYEKKNTSTYGYYEGTNIPTYTFVTGTSLKDTYYGEKGITYIYDYDKEEFLDYCEFLFDLGYSEYDRKTDTEDYSLTVYFEKDNKLFGVTAMLSYDEVWITILYDVML